MKIGIFDSGKGGLTVFDAIKKLLGEDGYEYYYLADSENCPYGEKNDGELYQIVTRNVEVLRDWGAEIIVIACNTATTKCIKQLRADFPKLSFVGTEPAIKLAADSNFKNILVLATPGTVSSERTAALVMENQKKEQKIKLLACPGLAETIEKYINNSPEKIEKKLEELLEKSDEYDAVVLGCTHYPLVKEMLKKYYPNAELLDGGTGVAERVRFMLQ